MLTASTCPGPARYRITPEPAVITRNTLGAFNRPGQRRNAAMVEALRMSCLAIRPGTSASGTHWMALDSKRSAGALTSIALTRHQLTVYDVPRHLSPMSCDITMARSEGFEPPAF